ncbi:helix-turn-helix domain-containing protein [Sphingomonas crocodyli]|uniref:XRE family transcriptional regulator n=1 Tax=Sphingomonas crocodyli TaxID=1979270 RepID=A0A437M771_9SPHN|nr:XRE family transcriptional regulator [Sphingomonas crocodyli]RVT93499.1 XRE family transcriptional regulator [Sphingomonas crocodyli]
MPFLAPKRTPRKIAIGGRIKSRRQELGLTLQALADASGLSAPFLSQAERNQTVPSLVSLTALAAALEVDIGYFMEVPKDENIVRRADEPEYIDIDSPVIYQQLSSALPGQMMDAILMTIPPGHRFPVDQREGEDFLFVVSGELVSQVGDLREVLRKGDSMHFRSISPHTAWNETDQPAILLYVGTPSIFRAVLEQKN